MTRLKRAVVTAMTLAAFAAVPKVGQRAPQFALPSPGGTSVSLKDYQGKSKVVLVFYRGYW